MPSTVPENQLFENRYKYHTIYDEIYSRDDDLLEHCFNIDIIVEDEYNAYKLYKSHKFIREIHFRWVNGKKQYFISISLFELFQNDSEKIIHFSKYFKVIDIIDKFECLKESNGYMSKEELITTLQEYYIPVEERTKKQIIKKK